MFLATIDEFLILTGLDPNLRYRFSVSAENGVSSMDMGSIESRLVVALDQFSNKTKVALDQFSNKTTVALGQFSNKTNPIIGILAGLLVVAVLMILVIIIVFIL